MIGSVSIKPLKSRFFMPVVPFSYEKMYLFHRDISNSNKHIDYIPF